jgi:two-component system response regulator AtoC
MHFGKIMKSINHQKRLLIVDDEKNMCHLLSVLLEKSGYRTDTANDGLEAIDKLKERNFDFILCDIKMPKMDGMDFLKSADQLLENSTVIMMSAYGTIDTAVEAMKLGAYDYISKPFKTDEVLLSLKKAEEREKLKRENLVLKKRIANIQERYSFLNMVAKSDSMRNIFVLAEKVAQYDTTVLITGESGTGKELIAKGIHLKSSRCKQPLIPVNCGGVPETLLESEFFGYKKGAFTGADRDKKGLFEEADCGSILLDEIGELPISLQVKLLRVLQENEIRPVGDAKSKKINTRIIAATARDLEKEVDQGTFRKDLYYRLNVVQIRVPSLRQRKEDIPLLCEHFIKKYNERFGKNIKGVEKQAMALLLDHSWAGNVRELENVIERAIILSDHQVLQLENFPPEMISNKGSTKDFSEIFSGFSLKEAQKKLEKEMIVKALEATEGNRTKASQLLDISHPSLLTKIKNYDISL